MKLGVCVVKCVGGDYERSLTSVECLPVDTIIYSISSFSELQQHFTQVKEDWTLVLYERETLDSCFVEAIQVMLEAITVSAYKFYCTVKTAADPLVIESVRLFRRGVLLRKDALRPLIPDTDVTRILDGWIYEHGTKKDIHKVFKHAASDQCAGTPVEHGAIS